MTAALCGFSFQSSTEANGQKGRGWLYVCRTRPYCVHKHSHLNLSLFAAFNDCPRVITIHFPSTFVFPSCCRSTECNGSSVRFRFVIKCLFHQCPWAWKRLTIHEDFKSTQNHVFFLWDKNGFTLVLKLWLSWGLFTCVQGAVIK